MSHLQYFSYPGIGERSVRDIHYSQAVRVGDTIQCSGQGGWDPLTEVIPTDLGDEVDQAFSNVDHTLKHAGAKGWEQVFRVNIYSVPLNSDIATHILRNFHKWMPGHQPIYTVIGTPKLGLDAMRIEVEVSAHVGGP